MSAPNGLYDPATLAALIRDKLGVLTSLRELLQLAYAVGIDDGDSWEPRVAAAEAVVDRARACRADVMELEPLVRNVAERLERLAVVRASVITEFERNVEERIEHGGTVILKGFDDKLRVIRVLRVELGLGLKHAKRLAESVPVHIHASDPDKLVTALIEAGAEVEPG